MVIIPCLYSRTLAKDHLGKQIALTLNTHLASFIELLLDAALSKDRAERGVRVESLLRLGDASIFLAGNLSILKQNYPSSVYKEFQIVDWSMSRIATDFHIRPFKIYCAF